MSGDTKKLPWRVLKLEHASASLGRLVRAQIADSDSSVWSPGRRICIANQHTGAAGAAGVGTRLGEALS